MGTKLLKPISNATRQNSVDDFSDITTKKAEKSLLAPLKKIAGRNNQGKITVRHRGGGVKRMYRLIDFTTASGEYEVKTIEYDPNRSARIALCEGEKGKKIYVIAPDGLRVGKKIIFGDEALIRPGHRMLLKNIPVGTFIYNIELNPGQGGKIARSAGVSAQLMGKEGTYVQVKLPSGEIRRVNEDCMASVGIVSNSDHSNIVWGKAGRIRKLGKRPTVLGKSMNPNDHPHGGGEGHTDIGLKHPKTPWGAPALGYKTRKKNHPTDKYIIRGRKKKNKR
jgi:large subunit ribosomal protein L2